MGKIEKLTNSLRNQTGKEAKGMKKVLISLALAMVLVMAMAVPVMAADTGSAPAVVNVKEFVSFTITDYGDSGLNFGSLDPGVTGGEVAQNGTGALLMDLASETSVDCDIKSQAADFKSTEMLVTSATATTAGSGTLNDTSTDFVAAGVAAGDILIDETNGGAIGVVTSVGTPDNFTLTYTGCADLTNGNTYSIQSEEASASTIAITNAQWSLTSTPGTAMSTSWQPIKPGLIPGNTQGVWHWLTIPDSPAPKAGDYSTTFEYQAVPVV